MSCSDHPCPEVVIGDIVKNLPYALRMRDSDVRKAALTMLAARHDGEDDTRIVEEMGVWSGSVRIDIAVINGSLCGYEIKSDRDTLDRLPFQRDLYGRVFDSVQLIVGKRHAEKAVALVPDWWGVMLATDEFDIVTIREVRACSTNPNIDPFLVAQLLWKEEAISILEEIGLARGWKAKRAKIIHEHLANSMPIDELRAGVRAALKKRTSWLQGSKDRTSSM